MKGKHSIVVRNRRVQFALELERNITVIRGDSATGKTTMLGMLRDYEELGAQSGVAVQCDKPCRTLTSRDWESQLSRMKDSIVFAKIFDQQGCIAYRCKTLNEARCVPGTLEALRADGVQIVILDSPEIYSEYAPYTYIEDLKEFIDKVAQMNRVAPVFRKH